MVAVLKGEGGVVVESSESAQALVREPATILGPSVVGLRSWNRIAWNRPGHIQTYITKPIFNSVHRYFTVADITADVLNGIR